MGFVKTILLILGLLFVVFSVGAQPLGPSENLKSKVDDKTKIDLPYQPDSQTLDEEKPSEDGEILEETTLDDSENPQDETNENQEEIKEEFSWESVPFLPMKGPALKPLPDPEF